MNIFYLDNDITLAAQYHCDKHVVKMILETAQMLSTVAGGPYRPVHRHHPCTLWAGESWQNFAWLHDFGLALYDEYTYRYNKPHKSGDVIASMDRMQNLPDLGLTDRPQCMPDQYRRADPVEAYRLYYICDKAPSISPFRYTGRSAPSWLQSGQVRAIMNNPHAGQQS